jgi:hypothetical protein
MPMTRSDIEAVLEKCPNLTAFGIGVFDERNLGRKEREAEFKEKREKLLTDSDGCSRAEAWLMSKPRRETINSRRSSYGLKHVAAHDIGYVTNGAFIAAAIHCGFKFQIYYRSPNVGINISERGLRDLKGKRLIIV